VRRAVVLAAVLLLAPVAHAAAPAVSAAVSGSGSTVTLTASGDAETYHWDLGDGATADGASVQHTYAKPGRYTATVTAATADGETAQAQVGVAVAGVTLRRLARPVDYGKRATFRGALIAADPTTVTLYRGSRPLGSARAAANGRFRITVPVLAPGGYRAVAGAARSAPVPVVVRPLLRARFLGSLAVGGRLQLRAQLHPAGGRLAVTIVRDGKQSLARTLGPAAVLELDTSRPSRLVIKITSIPALGFAARTGTLTALVVQPRLVVGAAGRTVAGLTAALAALHYVTPRTSAFDSRVLDGLYAFQKVQGLPRTGIADAATWAALADPRVPQPRYAQPADHLEVDKPHQVLYVVRGGRVASIVPVSTAGVPGDYTPTGQFAIYRKVTGFDPSPLGVLYDPMYFTGGYAIHGNPSVPPYPASHGCIRVPMWVIPTLYATNDYGETVYVY